MARKVTLTHHADGRVTATSTRRPSATLHQLANGHWSYTYNHGDRRRCGGEASELRYALEGIMRQRGELIAQDEARAAGRVCRFCGNGVESKVPTCTICRQCYYIGRDKADERAGLLAQLAALPSVTAADFMHTGGGCWALELTLTGGRVVLCTNGDAGVPEESWDRWGYVALYANADAPYEADSIAHRETETSTGPVADDEQPIGWTDAQLVDVVRELLTANGAKP